MLVSQSVGLICDLEACIYRETVNGDVRCIPTDKNLIKKTKILKIHYEEIIIMSIIL